MTGLAAALEAERATRAFRVLRLAVLRVMLREEHCVTLIAEGFEVSKLRCPSCHRRDAAVPRNRIDGWGFAREWACVRCGAHGDVVDLVALRNGWSWERAVALILQRYGGNVAEAHGEVRA